MEEMPQKDLRAYARFGGMLAVSSVLMYAAMYLNTYSVDHVYWSETRAFMTLIMTSVMAPVMFFFMRHMYTDRRLNALILIASVVTFFGALWLVRSQSTVDGVDYMEGMIPHHSIAILTSERAQIEDARVRKLAEGIIAAQRREIKEMEWLIEDIGAHGAATTEDEAASRPVPDFKASP